MSDLTHQPFANLRHNMLADQRAAIAAIHTAATTRKTLERALFGLTFDVEGRAHDVNTGRFTTRPATTLTHRSDR